MTICTDCKFFKELGILPRCYGVLNKPEISYVYGDRKNSKHPLCWNINTDGNCPLFDPILEPKNWKQKICKLLGIRYY